MKNICMVLGCKESEILGFKIINDGLTNTSFIFEVAGKKYVYRHPGEGTEKIISRPHEKKALELAKEANVDPTFLYMNAEEGWKISSYVEGIRKPDYSSFEDSRRVISVLRALHDKKLSVDWQFLPWEEACKIEAILRTEKGGIEDSSFEDLKAAVKACYDATLGDGVEKRSLSWARVTPSRKSCSWLRSMLAEISSRSPRSRPRSWASRSRRPRRSSGNTVGRGTAKL